jgi:serine/threonine-protein kinase
MSLAQGGQILLTRLVFDSARQALKGEELHGLNALQWLDHGPYVLKGIEEAVEICEVGEVGVGALTAPVGSEKAQRQVPAGEEPVLGWRPALGQPVPNSQWVLEKKLGEGGFGEVWVGRHQKLKERRVFKFCFRADRVRSLKREMTLFRVLKERIGDHPNIVRLLEVYFEHPPFYVVMDHVEGQDLKSWYEGQDAVLVPLPSKLDIVAQIADALQAAHDAGVIHRDVKPSNIIVQRTSRTGEVGTSSVPTPGQKSEPPQVDSYRIVARLTDFGIGQVLSEQALQGVTRTGFTKTIIAESSSSQSGSQMYMAPELLAGNPASIRSDIYSLGVVLYQLLVSDLTRPLTTDWDSSVGEPLLRQDLKRCFAGNPQERFAGAGQLAEQLRTFEKRQAAQRRIEHAERAAQRRRRAATLVGAVAIALLLLSGALTYGLRRAWHSESRTAQEPLRR